MKKFISIVLILCAGVSIAFARVIKGNVSCDGKGIPGVVVSDGIDCVLTDDNGDYEIPVCEYSRHVFVSTPSGYLPPVSEKTIPMFYKKIESQTDRYDFELRKNPVDDTRHVCIVQSDVQLVAKENLKEYRRLVDEISERKQTLDGMDVFGLDCGDIVGDTPSLFPPYIETVAEADMPVYRVIGNHDMDYYGRSFETSYSTFESYFGPSCYSFNRGNAHYVVINNNFYIGREYFYIGYIDERTFRWLERDLSFVPEGSLVILSMHIPSRLTPDVKPFSYSYGMFADQTVNASALHDMLKVYNAHIISGHMHYNLNICFSDSLMEHNTAAVCGTWWCSDICLDGTPVGYCEYTVDGNDVSWIYKSVGYPDTYQARAYLPGASDEYPHDVVANVWNWDREWKVELVEDGKISCEMERFTGFDPYSKRMCSDREKIKYDWISPVPTEHLFRARPSARSGKMEVRITDRFGNVYISPVTEFIYK